MLYECPHWINGSFDDLSKLTIYVFETAVKKIKLYAIAHISDSNTDSKDHQNLLWYDFQGNYIGKSLNDQKVIKNLNIIFLGKCKPSNTQCHKPGWVKNLYPNYKGNIDIYKHTIYGLVYLVDESAYDGPIHWLSESGKILHESPVNAPGTYSKKKINTDKKWAKNLIFIGKC